MWIRNGRIPDLQHGGGAADGRRVAAERLDCACGVHHAQARSLEPVHRAVQHGRALLHQPRDLVAQRGEAGDEVPALLDCERHGLIHTLGLVDGGGRDAMTAGGRLGEGMDMSSRRRGLAHTGVVAVGGECVGVWRRGGGYVWVLAACC